MEAPNTEQQWGVGVGRVKVGHGDLECPPGLWVYKTHAAGLRASLLSRRRPASFTERKPRPMKSLAHGPGVLSQASVQSMGRVGAEPSACFWLWFRGGLLVRQHLTQASQVARAVRVGLRNIKGERSWSNWKMQAWVPAFPHKAQNPIRGPGRGKA